MKANANKRYIAKEGTKGVTPEMIADAQERHLAARAVEREQCDEAEDHILAAVNAAGLPTGSTHCRHLSRKPSRNHTIHYLQHRTVEGRHDFVIDVFVTSAGMTDARVYPACLKRVDRFSFDVKQVGLDAGYSTMQILHALKEPSIQAAIAHRRHPSPKGLMGKWRFK